jgi:hypothetical protein
MKYENGKSVGGVADPFGRAVAVLAEVGRDLRNREYLHANWLRMERLKQATGASDESGSRGDVRCWVKNGLMLS